MILPTWPRNRIQVLVGQNHTRLNSPLSRLDAAREKIIIGELEDMSIETSQTEMQREWKEKEINTEYLRALG